MDITRYLGVRQQRPIVCLGDAGELTTGTMSGFDAAMPKSYSLRRLPRKWWEWDYIADCAEQMGLLTPTTTALGLGAGTEPLMFYFANKCGKVIASDLYSADTVWKEARFADTARVLDASPIPYLRSRVEVLNVDMRKTGVLDQSVDFVWSCSSIEHVPTLIDLFAVFKEIHRVLRIGGHAILTTEYCVTENPYLLPGINAWNREIFDLMVRSLPGFEMAGEVRLSFNSLHPANAPRPRRYPVCSSLPDELGQIPHYMCSGLMANPVGLSIVVPIAFVIRKTSSASVVNWEKADVSERLRTFSDGMFAFFAGNHDIACDKLETVYAEAVDDLQLRHLAFRFLVDARARRGEMKNPDEFADRIERFLEITPLGPVQDADCLDICAYLLAECGRPDRALTTYERCLLSPSTNRDHLFELAIRYLVLAERTGATRRAIEMVSAILADLMRFGMAGREMQAMFFKSASEKVSSRTVHDVQRGIQRRHNETIDALELGRRPWPEYLVSIARKLTGARNDALDGSSPATAPSSAHIEGR